MFVQDVGVAFQIPAFPELFDTPDTPWDSSQPFGPLFSLDGIHPVPRPTGW